jgi:hypothetical protein
MKKHIFVAVFLFVFTCLTAARTQAQQTWEMSAVWYDDSTGTVWGYSSTEVDYWSAAYYKAYVEGQLLDQYGTVLDDQWDEGQFVAEVYTAANADSADGYAEVGIHDVEATYYEEIINKSPEGCYPCDGCNQDCYYFYDDYWFYDVFGFSFMSTGVNGPWSEYYGYGPSDEIEDDEVIPLGETVAAVQTTRIPEHLLIGNDETASTSCGVRRQIDYVVHDHGHHPVRSVLLIEDPPTLTDACISETVKRTDKCSAVVDLAGVFTDFLFASCTQGACGFDLPHQKWQWCKTSTNHITLADLNYSVHPAQVKVNNHSESLAGTDLVP